MSSWATTITTVPASISAVPSQASVVLGNNSRSASTVAGAHSAAAAWPNEAVASRSRPDSRACCRHRPERNSMIPLLPKRRRCNHARHPNPTPKKTLNRINGAERTISVSSLMPPY